MRLQNPEVNERVDMEDANVLSGQLENNDLLFGFANISLCSEFTKKLIHDGMRLGSDCCLGCLSGLVAFELTRAVLVRLRGEVCFLAILADRRRLGVDGPELGWGGAGLGVRRRSSGTGLRVWSTVSQSDISGKASAAIVTSIGKRAVATNIGLSGSVSGEGGSGGPRPMFLNLSQVACSGMGPNTSHRNP